jgi:acetylornithine/succinyldiaminopimelate/putrescine aminotransferase
MWAHQHYGLVPDIITTSKALSGGYVPVGAMISSTAVSDSVYSSMERALVHSSTFKNNQLAMVAGLATLSVIEDEQLVEKARVTGELFETALAPLVERHEVFQEVRGKGLMIGLVFGAPSSPRARAKFRLLEAAHKGLFSQLIVGPLFQRHGILTQVAGDSMNVVKLLPPLICGKEEVDYFVDALDDVLKDVSRNSLIFEFGRTLAMASLHRDK